MPGIDDTTSDAIRPRVRTISNEVVENVVKVGVTHVVAVIAGDACKDKTNISDPVNVDMKNVEKECSVDNEGVDTIPPFVRTVSSGLVETVVKEGITHAVVVIAGDAGNESTSKSEGGTQENSSAKGGNVEHELPGEIPPFVRTVSSGLVETAVKEGLTHAAEVIAKDKDAIATGGDSDAIATGGDSDAHVKAADNATADIGGSSEASAAPSDPSAAAAALHDVYSLAHDFSDLSLEHSIHVWDGLLQKGAETASAAAAAATSSATSSAAAAESADTGGQVKPAAAEKEKESYHGLLYDMMQESKAEAEEDPVALLARLKAEHERVVEENRKLYKMVRSSSVNDTTGGNETKFDSTGPVTHDDAAADENMDVLFYNDNEMVERHVHNKLSKSISCLADMQMSPGSPGGGKKEKMSDSMRRLTSPKRPITSDGRHRNNLSPIKRRELGWMDNFGTNRSVLKEDKVDKRRQMKSSKGGSRPNTSAGCGEMSMTSANSRPKSPYLVNQKHLIPEIRWGGLRRKELLDGGVKKRKNSRGRSPSPSRNHSPGAGSRPSTSDPKAPTTATLAGATETPMAESGRYSQEPASLLNVGGGSVAWDSESPMKSSVPSAVNSPLAPIRRANSGGGGAMLEVSVDNAHEGLSPPKTPERQFALPDSPRSPKTSNSPAAAASVASRPGTKSPPPPKEGKIIGSVSAFNKHVASQEHDHGKGRSPRNDHRSEHSGVNSEHNHVPSVGDHHTDDWIPPTQESFDQKLPVVHQSKSTQHKRGVFLALFSKPSSLHAVEHYHGPHYDPSCDMHSVGHGSRELSPKSAGSRSEDGTLSPPVSGSRASHSTRPRKQSPLVHGHSHDSSRRDTPSPNQHDHHHHHHHPHDHHPPQQLAFLAGNSHHSHNIAEKLNHRPEEDYATTHRFSPSPHNFHDKDVDKLLQHAGVDAEDIEKERLEELARRFKHEHESNEYIHQNHLKELDPSEQDKEAIEIIGSETKVREMTHVRSFHSTGQLLEGDQLKDYMENTAKVVIHRARALISGSETFRNRPITKVETKLMESPYAMPRDQTYMQRKDFLTSEKILRADLMHKSGGTGSAHGHKVRMGVEY